MSLPLTTAPSSICILRLSAIGDVTHVLPTVRSIQHQWPETKITWIIGKIEAQLVGDIPDIEFIVFDKSAGRAAFKDLRQQLKGRSFDVLLHMQISLRASLVSLFVRAPIKLGFNKARARNLQTLFTNHQIEPKSDRQHMLDGALEFAHALGVKQDVIKWDIPLTVGPEYLKEIVPDGKYMVINPCTSARAMSKNWRIWRADSYAQLVDFISDEYGLPVVLTGGPDQAEIDYGRSIITLSMHKPINMIGKTSLKQLLTILNGAELVVAPDTGPIHMANACGTQTIGLYAGTNPLRAGPYSFLDDVVNAYPEAVKNETGKTVDQVRWGKRVRDPAVMDLIRVKDVTAKLKQVYHP